MQPVIRMTMVVAVSLLAACAQQGTPSAGMAATGASATAGSARAGAAQADTGANDQVRADAPPEAATSDRAMSRQWEGLGSTGGGTGTGTSSGTLADPDLPAAGTR